MKHIIKKHKKVWVNKNFIVSSVTGGLLLIASLFINYFAGIYATKQASNSVTDVFLTNIPTLNMDFLIVEGAFIFAFFILILMIYEPKGVPFILKSIAIFIVIRAVFVSMTHIGPSPDRAILNDNVIVSKFAVGGELFFSGHTGMPFLLALAFWHNKSGNYRNIAYAGGHRGRTAGLIGTSEAYQDSRFMDGCLGAIYSDAPLAHRA